MTQKITCGGCKTEWFGLAIAHCTSCHRTFTSFRTFDIHRAAQFKLGEPREVKTRKGETVTRQKKIETRPAGQCYDPLESGLVLNDRGYWGQPPSDYWENRKAEEDKSADPEQSRTDPADRQPAGVVREAGTRGAPGSRTGLSRAARALARGRRQTRSVGQAPP